MGKKEIFSAYFAGLLQGLVLVAFPAASTIFTSPHEFNFSSTMYGSLFLPQACLSTASSLFSAKLSKLTSSKAVFLVGLIANMLSMALLAMSYLAKNNQSQAFVILILATTCLGI